MTHRRLLSALLCALVFACGTPPVESAASPPATGDGSEAPAQTPTGPPPRRLPTIDHTREGVAVGVHGAVATAEAHATRVGLDVLQRGGNAVDAAVAVAFALAVTHPTAGNLGGGGFMVVRMADGTASAIDYRETAPASASADMYLDAEGNVTKDSLLGPRAAGVPGTVAGMALALERFGTRPWRELLQPAIALARDGHVIDERHAASMTQAVGRMKEAGFESSAKHYLAPDGSPLAAGQRWMQPELARTLETIADEGPGAFYAGPLAKRLADGVRALGGLWTEQDLASYKAIAREPIAFDYLGHRVISMPPPSAGGVVLRQILGASELLGMARYPWGEAQSTHLYVEAARRSYADRNYLLGDPDFADVPVAKLTGDAYLKQRMGDIDPAKATPSEEIKGGAVGAESPETTHYSVVDGQGNAVANTYTLNTGFGSKVVVEGTGVLLNNEMDDFAAKPGEPNVYGLVQGARNRIQPGKRMLSSMTPTIIAKDGELRAVLGTPGGPTITTTVAQLVRALVDYGVPLDQAVAAPRVHHQWKPDRVIVEPHAPQALRDGLKALGHEVIESRWGRIGHANCIEVDPGTRGFRAVADVERAGGMALAY